MTTLTRDAIRGIINAAHFAAVDNDDPGEWSIQGLGMLRLHLPGDWRLNVWHPDFAVVGISDIHDHPWDFTSYVVNGRMTSHIYQEPVFATEMTRAERYHIKEIVPGIGLATVKELKDVNLCVHHSTVTRKGQSYRQAYHELHKSEFTAGTVTLIHMVRASRPDVARTAWPQGSPWITAEPRQATPYEVEAFCEAALATWEPKK